ncbi:adenylate/guanylate cyclase domain-containing protein [Mycolicibacterium novocastrense]|uniref:adenylate/guanylate cyclase domain-containing protein n=1 Tax=Mycolicibacterium novocastrense TaxID=59813 RepID=UPI000ACE7D51
MSAGDTPTGVVTFLFTDIEGSTRRWESDADAMRVALACHDKVLRSAIEAHDGFVFSHSGDGLAAAFASPSAAVEAAVDAQRELELPVRMGIATGEAELRDGDYFGTVLNRAARVMAAGHGGQILVAESTAGSSRRRGTRDPWPAAAARRFSSGDAVSGPRTGATDRVSGPTDSGRESRESARTYDQLHRA